MGQGGGLFEKDRGGAMFYSVVSRHLVKNGVGVMLIMLRVITRSLFLLDQRGDKMFRHASDIISAGWMEESLF